MPDLDALWKDYREKGSRAAKDKLLAEYAGVVRYAAQRVAVGLPPHIELGDLMGAGVMGLIRAVETFDPGRETRFETFATHKVRGAILDELRALDWVPRSVRQKSRNLQRAYAKLASELGRMPYDDELAEHLGVTLAEFEQMLAEVAPATMVSMEETLQGRDAEGGGLTLGEMVEDEDAVDALNELSEREARGLLKDAIAGLPEKEKLVVALYHYEELTFKEIGEILGITESRVCQIHSKAMHKLRARLTLKARL